MINLVEPFSWPLQIYSVTTHITMLRYLTSGVACSSVKYATQVRCSHITTMSKLFAPIATQKEIKQKLEHEGTDNTIASSRLLENGGYIVKIASGFYTILPLGQRVIEKMVKIIDRELAKIDGQKVSMPQMLSRDLWEQSGRWEQSLDQLFVVRDRRGKEYCMAPTHEECVTFLAQQQIQHYGKKQLPLRIYQIGNKYRDELKPKFGLMRAKEFLMKDMYSFDENVELAFITYDEVVQAYRRIFSAFELDHVVVDADTGNIGGTRSNEFQVLSSAGDDDILLCGCDPLTRYAANVEKAFGAPKDFKDPFASIESKEINIDSKQIVEHLSNDEGIEVQLVEITLNGSDGKPGIPFVVPVIISSSRTVNPLKIKAKLSAYEVRSITEMIPYDFKNGLLIDNTAAEFVSSVQQGTSEYVKTTIADFRVAVKGDLCLNTNNPNCKCSPLQQNRGIEVGHVFFLGQKYSRPFKIVIDSKYIEMGCYGIGVSRTLQSVVETQHDDKGIIWPLSIAPYRACIVPMRPAKGKDMVSNKFDSFC